MSKPNNTADKFALLFSADWFRPHWKLTGFVPRRGKAPAFQREMRRLVAEMMGDETSYWNVSFNETRVLRTRDGFLSAVDLFQSGESRLGLIREVIADKLSSETLADLSMAFWHDYETSVDTIGQADLTATTWDRNLVELTQDLPSLLQDFVCVNVLRVA